MPSPPAPLPEYRERGEISPPSPGTPGEGPGVRAEHRISGSYFPNLAKPKQHSQALRKDQPWFHMNVFGLQVDWLREFRVECRPDRFLGKQVIMMQPGARSTFTKLETKAETLYWPLVALLFVFLGWSYF